MSRKPRWRPSRASRCDIRLPPSLHHSSSCCGKIKPTVTNEVNSSPESTGLLSAELHPSRAGRHRDKQDGERCFSCCVTSMTDDGRVDARRIHILVFTSHNPTMNGCDLLENIRKVGERESCQSEKHRWDFSSTFTSLFYFSCQSNQSWR